MKTEDRGQRTEGPIRAYVRLRRTISNGASRKQKFIAFIGVVACSVLLAAWGASPALAGNLDSSAAPTDDSTRMYTLEQIYDKVNDGTTPTKQSGGFNEPAAVPGSTMHTLDNIEAKIAAGTTDAAVGDVTSGKTFITRTASSGETLLTGTASAGSTGLPKTGQTTNYATGDDETYGDPAGGHDVGLTQGEGTWATYWTNGHRFTTSTVDTDDVVTDNATGLMWAADGNTAGCYSGGSRTWTEAITWAEGLTFAGYSDWRLPNAYELFSICLLEAGVITGVKGALAPYINQTVFPNTVNSFYWSSTTYPGSTDHALGVGFGGGYVGYGVKTNNSDVRAVRGGQ